jgi:hypothetical protein
MAETFSGLDSLVEQDEEAKRYFATLPYAMKQTVRDQAESIHSFDGLRGCVETRLPRNE